MQQDMQQEKIIGLEQEFAANLVRVDPQSTALASVFRHGRPRAEACDLLLAEAKGWGSGSFRNGQRCLAGWGHQHTWQSHSYEDDEDNAGNGWGGYSYWGSSSGYSDALNYGRHWKHNCIYVDMGRLEGTSGETRSCYGLVAATHALYNEVAEMTALANAKLAGSGWELFVAANNTDGTYQTSNGTHLNVSITRSLFTDIFHKRPHVLGVVASFLALAVPVFGQGHVLRRPDETAAFVLSQRAHHLTRMVDTATTTPFKRPLVNARDESHSGIDGARLHLIPFDANMQHTSMTIRIWLTTCILALLEHPAGRPPLMAILLDDPLAALRQWSSGFNPATGHIEGRARLANGLEVTPVDLLSMLAEIAEKAYAAGHLPDEIVPDTKTVLPFLEHLISDLASGDVFELARHLDWALKWMIIEREMNARGLDLMSDEIQLTNLTYGHIDKAVGGYWPFERSGFVETCVSLEEIAAMQHEGPTDTRAYARKAILEKFPESVVDVDWSSITLKEEGRHGFAGMYGQRRQIVMGNPGGYGKAEVGAIIDKAQTVTELYDALCPPQEEAAAAPIEHNARYSPTVTTPSYVAPMPRIGHPPIQEVPLNTCPPGRSCLSVPSGQNEQVTI